MMHKKGTAGGYDAGARLLLDAFSSHPATCDCAYQPVTPAEVAGALVALKGTLGSWRVVAKRVGMSQRRVMELVQAAATPVAERGAPRGLARRSRARGRG